MDKDVCELVEREIKKIEEKTWPQWMKDETIKTIKQLAEKGLK